MFSYTKQYVYNAQRVCICAYFATGHFGRVQACMRLDQVVSLVLCNRADMEQVFVSSANGAGAAASAPNEPFHPLFLDAKNALSTAGVAVLMDTVARECARLLQSPASQPASPGASDGGSVAGSRTSGSSGTGTGGKAAFRPVEQAVKAMAYSLARLETPALHSDLLRLTRELEGMVC